MNLRQLEAFVNIANNHSFSETAEKMFVSQPTISGYINALEDELRTILFARSTKEIVLTEAGSELYSYAKEIVKLTDEIGKKFHITDEMTEPIVISASSIPSRYILPKFLADFSSKYQNIKFKINEGDSLSVIEDVKEKRADIGFTGTRISGVECKYTKILDDELVVITPNNEYYKNEIKKGIDFINTAPIIFREAGSGTRREAISIIKTLGFDINKLNIVAEMENQETIKRSVRDGMGISFISKLAINEGLLAGNVLCKSLSDEGINRSIYMVISSRYNLKTNPSKFHEFIRKSFIENPDK